MYKIENEFNRSKSSRKFPLTKTYYFLLFLRFQKFIHTSNNILFRQFNMEDSQNQINQICDKLLINQKFLSAVASRLPSSSQKMPNSSCLDDIIQQIQFLLEELIRKKLQAQRNQLIEENNRIIEQIKYKLERKQSRVIQGSSSIDTSFTQIHNIINQEKRKAMQRFTDAELEKSISFIDRYDDAVEKIQQMQKKVKELQDKYQTNFKSLWNVLSMTSSAVFQHIKQNKSNKVKKNNENMPPKAVEEGSFLMSFWK